MFLKAHYSSCSACRYSRTSNWVLRCPTCAWLLCRNQGLPPDRSQVPRCFSLRGAWEFWQSEPSPPDHQSVQVESPLGHKRQQQLTCIGYHWRLWRSIAGLPWGCTFLAAASSPFGSTKKSRNCFQTGRWLAHLFHSLGLSWNWQAQTFWMHLFVCSFLVYHLAEALRLRIHTS